MDFKNAQLPTLTPLKNSFVVDDVENDLRNLFIDLFETHLAAQAFDVNVLGAGHLGSFDQVRKMVNWDGLALLDGEREETATRYLYRAWKSRNSQGRGFHFLRTYLQMLFPNAATVDQMAQDKAFPYPSKLTPMTPGNEFDATKYSTSRIRIMIDRMQSTFEALEKMPPILRSIVPARFVLEFALLTSSRKINYIGAQMIAGATTTVYPAATQPAEWVDVTYIGAALTTESTVTIYPKPA